MIKYHIYPHLTILIVGQHACVAPSRTLYTVYKGLGVLHPCRADILHILRLLGVLGTLETLNLAIYPGIIGYGDFHSGHGFTSGELTAFSKGVVVACPEQVNRIFLIAMSQERNIQNITGLLLSSR